MKKKTTTFVPCHRFLIVVLPFYYQISRSITNMLCKLPVQINREDSLVSIKIYKINLIKKISSSNVTINSLLVKKVVKNPKNIFKKAMKCKTTNVAN